METSVGGVFTIYLVLVKALSWLMLASLLAFSLLWELKRHDGMRITGQMGENVEQSEARHKILRLK